MVLFIEIKAEWFSKGTNSQSCTLLYYIDIFLEECIHVHLLPYTPDEAPGDRKSKKYSLEKLLGQFYPQKSLIEFHPLIQHGTILSLILMEILNFIQ